MDYSRCFDYCNNFKNKTTKIKIPYFIALFILAMILNTYPHGFSCSFSFFSKNRTYCNIVLIAGLSATVLKSVELNHCCKEFCFGHALPATLFSILYFI
jgi:uncharacterized membrane protein YadS